jgi:hypothetical protein
MNRPTVRRPPRSLPASLGVRILFGGFGQLGWVLVAFGMVFVWIFDAGGGVAEWIRFSGDVETAQGTTTGWRQTNLSINEVDVYETMYAFDLPGEGSFEGSSFDTGSWVADARPVTVEYVDGDPSTSRIQGMRLSRGGLGVAFVFIFPGVGLLMALAALRRGHRVVRLLRDGEVTHGVLRSKEPTGMKINEQPVLRLTFEFDVPGQGIFQAVAKTHRPERLEDEEQELLVYDRRDPGQAVMLDSLPCEPRIGDRGQLEAGRWGAPTALYLLLPGLSVLTLARYVASLV